MLRILPLPPRRVIVAGGVMSLLLVGTGAAQVSAGEPALAVDRTVAFTGTAPGVRLDDAAFTVYVHPSQETERTLQHGDDVLMYRLPADSVVRTAGSDYALSIDPATLPDSHIGDDGLVTVDVLIEDPARGTFGTTTASAQLLRDARSGQALWADPHGTEAARAAQHDGVVALSAHSAPAEPVSMDTVTMGAHPAGRTRAGGIGTRCSEEPVPAAAGGEFVAAATLVANSNRWVTIGSSYPVGGNTARMVFTSQSSTTMGIAYSASGSKGSYSASGSKTVSAGWEHGWKPNSSGRVYRIQVNYGKYHYKGGSHCTGKYDYFRWLPRWETGAPSSASSSRPNYTNCVKLDKNSDYWSRSRSDGKDYSASAGVKIKGLIGIDLKSQRSYSTNSKITYHLSGKRKMICGNNHVPAKASRVMLKYA